LDAVERSLAADEDCGGQLMLLQRCAWHQRADGRGAGDAHPVSPGGWVKEQIAPELAEDLIDLVRAYLK